VTSEQRFLKSGIVTGIVSTVNMILLVFGLGTFARGLYALVTQDVEEDNEHMVGRAAVQHGVVLVVIGLGIASHAIVQWSWINSLVAWLHRHE
jgi:sulfite exporter TauE/SafE